MASPRFPTADGLQNALTELAKVEGGRLNSTIPVLLAVEAGLTAGQQVTIDGNDAVPNPRIFAWLDEWFDVSGNGKDYFVPFPLPGGASRHRRDEKILAQGTMTAAKGHGWVTTAQAVPGSVRDRAYPLADIGGWRDAIADGLPTSGGAGIDAALLGIWLGRTSGIPAESTAPTRDELVAFALDRLGLPIDGSHALCTGSPPILRLTGDDEWEEDYFGDTALSLESVAEVCAKVDPGSPVSAPTGGSISAVQLPATQLELDDYVRRMLRVSIASSNAVMLVGPPGTGKTELVSEVEALLADGKGCTLGITTPPAGIRTVTPDDEWSSATLIGGLTLVEGNLAFRPGYVLEAIARNEWLLLDEANRGDLDKIFGGLLTWLTGKRVQVGMTSTAHDAQPVYLEWSDDEECSTAGIEQLKPGAAATEPVRFIAGRNWRFLGTFNPVDAQRVFKLGQALGRRFRRVPVPPPSATRFEGLIETRASALDAALRAAVVRLYSVHEEFEPPLGAAPLLDLCEYLLTAATIGNGVSTDDEVAPNGGEESATEPAEVAATSAEAAEVAALVQPEAQASDEPTVETDEDSEQEEDDRLDAADSRLLAEAYVASFGTWLAQLTPSERTKMRARLVPGVFSSADWSWLDRMFRSL